MDLLQTLGLRAKSATAETAAKVAEARANLERAMRAYETSPADRTYDEVEALRRRLTQVEILHQAAVRREAEAAAEKALKERRALERELAAIPREIDGLVASSEARVRAAAETFARELLAALDATAEAERTAGERHQRAIEIQAVLGLPSWAEPEGDAVHPRRARPHFAHGAATRKIDRILHQEVVRLAGERGGHNADANINALRTWVRP